jgi:MFS transporter, DHA1 family, multidrug resistance protein
VGIALILLMLTKTMPLILTYVGVLAFGMALLIPTLATLTSRQSDTDIGTALGLQNAASTLGQFAGPATGGLLFIWSIHIPYLVAAVPLLGCSIYLTVDVFLERYRKGNPQNHKPRISAEK